MRNRVYFFLFCFILLMGVYLRYVLPKQHHLLRYRETKLILGTVVSLDVCFSTQEEDDVKELYALIWNRLKNINERLGPVGEMSEVVKLNQSYPQVAILSPDTYYLMETSQRFSHLTQGAFDITIEPLRVLWKESVTFNQVPDIKRIQKIKKSIGMHNLRLLENHKVQILNPFTKINLGGIAKGYAVDEAARLFREHHFDNFYINAGGDIYVGGLNCQDKPWRIGIRHPLSRDKIIEIIELKDAAVTTSGDYEQFYQIQEKRWSHIINPKTGFPAQGIVSATVIAPSATTADALSTALCVLDQEKGLDLIYSLGQGYEALLMSQDQKGQIKEYMSSRFPVKK